MVAERFEELKELVALVELVLLVSYVGIHETIKVRMIFLSKMASGVRVVVQLLSYQIDGIGLI